VEVLGTVISVDDREKLVIYGGKWIYIVGTFVFKYIYWDPFNKSHNALFSALPWCRINSFKFYSNYTKAQNNEGNWTEFKRIHLCQALKIMHCGIYTNC
jgi:hypothetical protein